MKSATTRSRIARRRRIRALAWVAVLGALALAGCGDDSDEPAAAAAEPLGQEVAGSVAQLAQCRDWNKGTDAEQLATIGDIRSQINLEDSGIDAPPLTDAEAMELFDNACAETFTKGFRLYVLYARAAGFAPLTR